MSVQTADISDTKLWSQQNEMSEAMLKDYMNEDTLKHYLCSLDDPDEPAILTRYFTFYSLLPDLRDKIVLDLPCGMGHKARKFISQSRAKKVIAVDIVEKQLEMSKEADVAAGIKPGQIEYVLHDARKPKVVADLCINVHLFCFAQEYTELLGMSRSIYLNLKPGGACYSIMCSLSRDNKLVKQFEDFDAKILQVDPWQGDIHKARRFHYVCRGFNYNIYVWEYEVVCQALKEVGFSNVELHPYQEDPSYSGKLNLPLFNSIVQGNVVIATK